VSEAQGIEAMAKSCAVIGDETQPPGNREKSVDPESRNGALKPAARDMM
jgi:hypothetical protein